MHALAQLMVVVAVGLVIGLLCALAFASTQRRLEEHRADHDDVPRIDW